MIIAKCNITQGEKLSGGIDPKAISLVRGAIVFDGVVYEDDILPN
jgi:hypothetical protein